MSESAYTPSKWQQEIHSLQANEILGAGSAGVGKSIALLAEPLSQIITEHQRMVDPNHPHPIAPGRSTGWTLHLRRQLTELKQTISRSQAMYRAIDPGAHYDAGEYTWTFTSGYKVQFGHCKDADDHTKYLSMEYCMAKGQRVVMGDGSLKAIETIEAGESVMTLEGPRKVLATWATGIQHCAALDVLHPTTGDLIGTQIHPTTHPVLALASGEYGSSVLQDTPEALGRGLGLSREACWQDYESLLDGIQATTEKRASTIDGQSCFVGSDGERRAAQQLPELNVRLVLHEPALRLAAHRRSSESCEPGESGQESCASFPHQGRRLQSTSSSQRPSRAGEQLEQRRCEERPSCGVACATLGQGTARGFPERCSGVTGPRGGQLLCEEGAVPAPPLRPIDAGERGHGNPLLGSEERFRTDTRPDADTWYPHFYSGERRVRTEAVRIGIGKIRYAGQFQTFDLTVEDANHYIGEFGTVNCQTLILFDELTTFSKEQYDGITSRLRSSDPVLKNMLKVLSMSNPGVSPGSDPHWVRKRFVDPAPEGRRLIRTKLRRKDGTEFFRTRVYWPGKLDDNPNPDFKAQYEETLLDKPAHIRKAYLEGDWYFAPGSFYGEDFDPSIHVINVHKIPEDWPVFRSMDWGFKSRGVIHWAALDPDNNIVVFDEYVFKERTDAMVAEDIKRIEKRHGLWGFKSSRITGPADTQIWEERGDTAKRKVDVFLDKGVPWVQADKKSRQDNAERIIKRLKDHNGGTRLPGLMFMSNCKYIISTLPQIRTSELNPEEPEKGGEDHGVDSLSYLVAYASVPERVQVRNVDNGDELDAEEDEKPVGRGRWGYGSEVA